MSETITTHKQLETVIAENLNLALGGALNNYKAAGFPDPLRIVGEIEEIAQERGADDKRIQLLLADLRGAVVDANDLMDGLITKEVLEARIEDQHARKIALMALESVSTAEAKKEAAQADFEAFEEELEAEPTADPESVVKTPANDEIQEATSENKNQDLQPEGPSHPAEDNNYADNYAKDMVQKKEKGHETKAVTDKITASDYTVLMSDAMPGTIKRYTTPPTGLHTGLIDIDKQYGRILKPGCMTVVAARPSMGKTVFGEQIAEHHAVNISVMVWSLEMSTEQILDRYIAKNSGVTLQQLENREIPPEKWPDIHAAAQKAQSYKLYINDLSAASVDQINTETRRVNRDLITNTGHGLALVVVDYLQLATAEGATRELEVGNVSACLRCLAKDLKVPVLALAQLSRDVEKRQDKRPCLSDIRESGRIEQDADIIGFLYRETVYCEDCKSTVVTCTKNHEKEAEFIIAKNRNGSLGSVQLHFDGPKMTFRDATKSGSWAVTDKKVEAKKEEKRMERVIPTVELSIKPGADRNFIEQPLGF